MGYRPANVPKDTTSGEARLAAALLRERAKIKAEHDDFEEAVELRETAKYWTSIARNAKKNGR